MYQDFGVGLDGGGSIDAALFGVGMEGLKRGASVEEGFEHGVFLSYALAGTTSPVAGVSPQFVAGGESRPDLAICGSLGVVTAFIEAKFWAGLTDATGV
jgi:hypothetical protein